MKNTLTRNPSNCHPFGFALMMLFLILPGVQLLAQTAPDTRKPVAPELLPGKGLKQYDFFYAGEAKMRNMYIVCNGKIAWSYIDITGKGEISGAILMANGNILFAHQYGITLINRDKKILWNYETPQGYETPMAGLASVYGVSMWMGTGNPDAG